MRKILLTFLSLILLLLIPSSVHAFSGTFQITGGYIGTAYGSHIIGGAFSQDASIQCNLGDPQSRFYDASTNSPVGTHWDSCQFSTPGSTIGVYSRDLPDGEYYVVLADFAGNTWTSQVFSIVNDQIIVLAPNQSPSINTIANSTLNEGDTYLANDSFADPDSTSWTATVDYGDGTGVQPSGLSGMSFFLSHIYKDNGIYTVTVSITDNQGATGTGTATVTVNNVPPTVGAITAPTNPVQVNTAVTASANFTDPGILDTHTVVWNWGDSTISIGSVTENNGSGSASGTHIYTAAGIYTVSITVTDNHGASGTASYNSIVVYDPSAGSIKGSGSFNSQAGAYVSNPTVSGELKFNIQAKYKGDNTVPTGKINLDFKKTNFSFDSISLEWLVINGDKAQLKGTGTFNGSGSYTIFIAVLDGAKKSGADKIRIKITDFSGNVIYDNQMGSPENADPTAVVSKGSIKIHN